MRHCWIVIVVLNSAASSFAQDEGVMFFEQKIRPVLVQHCYSCHSVTARDAKKLQGNLFLDSAEGTLAGGETGPSLVKGKGAESRLIKALKYDGLEMPPAGKLSDEIIADFVKWIDMGAPDPRTGSAPIKPKREINLEEGRKFWSFQPLRVIAPPDVKKSEWSRNGIDRFIAAKHEEMHLKSSGPETREKLLRRVYFDLIGLPPTPEQLHAYLSDSSPNALEKVVDELLASERYGEKWARHWLDVVRYAESGGYEFDAFRFGAFHYRDWVIRAINNDMPYNQFVRMQLAGDKLVPDDYLAAAASGFLVAGPYPGQITAKTVEGIRYDQLDDMIMTIGGSMLGLTLGCVRCHDHKYDPIQQKDYYALAADLGRTVHGSRFLDPDPSATASRIAQHDDQHQKLLAASRVYAMSDLPTRFENWKGTELPKQAETPRWQVLEPVTFDAERSWLKRSAGGVVAYDGALIPGTLLTRKGEKRGVRNEEVQRITYRTHQKNIQSVRIDALTDQALPARGPGLNGDGSFKLGELKITARPITENATQPPVELKLKSVFAAFADDNQPVAHAVDGNPATAWVVQATARKDNAAIFELETPLAGFPGGTELVWEFQFRDAGLGKFRCSISTEPNPATWAGDFAPQHVAEIRAILAANGNVLPEALRPEMLRWLAPFDDGAGKVLKEEQAHVAARPRPPIHEIYTTVDGGQDVFLLRRDEVDNKQGKAEPGFVQVLWRGESDPAASAPPPVVDPRVRLAEWMTDVDRGAGPLLARVMVNRLWQHHFGKGIVGTPNDFGAQGDRPTHPELLEWLATQFVTGGWKLKPLHKQMILSATYQQSHDIQPENLQIDPANRYVWYHQPRRLDAELIRDSLLSIGGNLELNMFGPSIMDNTPRRSVYLRVKRSELIPLMTMFDAPEPTQSVGERISTTVPTQSLAMLNSPFVRQQAEKLAQKIRPSKETPLKVSVENAYRMAFSRSPSESELASMGAFLEAQQTILGGDPATKVDQALVEFCQVLLCLNEFVYID